MSSTAAKLSTVDPSTGQTLSQYKIMDREQVTLTVKQARKAFENWKGIGFKRAEFIRDFAQELRRNKTNLAKTATQEMGKSIKESTSEAYVGVE
jgi:acyl-CoA reductase-like NAD-dependent aldehyde dehydrogenase